jgi:hypothetical protein
MEWTDLAQDRYRWRVLVNAAMKFRGSIKCWGISRVAEDPLAYEERLLYGVGLGICYV